MGAMKKKVVIIGIIVSIGVLLMFILCSFIGALRPEQLNIEVKPMHSVNYNNYVVDNCLDYKSGVLAWQSNSFWGPKITVVSQNNDTTVLRGITAPFQILDNRIIHIKNGTLISTTINNQRNEQIGKNVSSFLANKNRVLFLSNNHLVQYELDSKNTCTLKENVYQFFLHHDMLYTIDMEGRLSQLTTDGIWYEKFTIPDMNYPFYAMPCENALIYLWQNELRVVDLSDGTIEKISLSDNSYANNRIVYICDDRNLFVSFQATETDGSIVKDVNHSDNGTWRINLQTMEKERVLYETFQQLYLFDGSLLMALKDNQLYQICIENGNVIRISS